MRKHQLGWSAFILALVLFFSSADAAYVLRQQGSDDALICQQLPPRRVAGGRGQQPIDGVGNHDLRVGDGEFHAPGT